MNQAKQHAIDAYLKRYAEPERSLADTLPAFERCLLVPACGEGLGLQPLLSSIPATESLVMMVLVNARADAPAWVHEKNQLAAELLLGLGPTTCLSPTATSVAWGATTVVVVERTPETAPIPEKQGVGLSRKILGDLALAMWSANKLRSPWLRMTDADAQLPANYFEEPPAEAAGFLHPFCHHACTGFEKSIRGYEAFLHSYVLGLDHAGSPYAFHTIGSTIDVHAESYAAVRGMPRREAGEDFYFLNKLAKVGPIAQGSEGEIVLSGRPSTRVPFGTGRGVRTRVAQLGERYSDSCYEVLRMLIAETASGAEGLEGRVGKELSVFSAPQRDAALEAMNACGAFAAAQFAAQNSSNEQRRYLQRFHERFDGFATMKLIRRLTRSAFPQVDVQDNEPDELRRLNHERLRSRPQVGLSSVLPDAGTTKPRKSPPKDRRSVDRQSEVVS